MCKLEWFWCIKLLMGTGMVLVCQNSRKLEWFGLVNFQEIEYEGCSNMNASSFITFFT